MILVSIQGCALTEPGGLWHPTFAPAGIENVIIRFFIQTICNYYMLGT